MLEVQLTLKIISETIRSLWFSLCIVSVLSDESGRISTSPCSPIEECKACSKFQKVRSSRLGRWKPSWRVVLENEFGGVRRNGKASTTQLQREEKVYEVWKIACLGLKMPPIIWFCSCNQVKVIEEMKFWIFEVQQCQWFIRLFILFWSPRLLLWDYFPLLPFLSDNESWTEKPCSE